jgi:ABC-type sugar transport system ATPase subunit
VLPLNDYLLEVVNISKSFPGVKALNSVTISVKKGEVLALVGENGAGKSTLMKILSGAYPCTTFEGLIKVEGKERSFYSPKDSQASGIEMIYQEISLIPDLTVAENIYVGNYPGANGIFVRWSKMLEQAKEVLATVGLNIDPSMKVRLLSTSQQQMITIAKAITKKPKVLVLDEPTSALTKNESEYLFKIIKDMASQGMSCVYISHKLEEVFEISDRINVLRDGQLIGEVNRADYNHQQIISMMVGRTIENRYPKQKVELGKEVLRVENLSVMHKYIKGKTIIHNINFAIKEGEILGLAGLVGSGRSELVSAIFGCLPKSDGHKIFIEGKQVYIKNPIDAIKHGMALVSEDRRLSGIIGGLSIRENSTLVSLKKHFKNYIISFPKERTIVNEYKSKLSIKAPDIETKVKNLSGGNQQKVVISKWLMNHPKILIFDEPTRGIDVGAKYEIYNIMVELAKQGVTIIMISSELPEILGMCDRIIVLSEGKMVDEFTSDDASEDRVMLAATRTS